MANYLWRAWQSKRKAVRYSMVTYDMAPPNATPSCLLEYTTVSYLSSSSLNAFDIRIMFYFLRDHHLLTPFFQNYAAVL